MNQESPDRTFSSTAVPSTTPDSSPNRAVVTTPAAPKKIIIPQQSRGRRQPRRLEF